MALGVLQAGCEGAAAPLVGSSVTLLLRASAADFTPDANTINCVHGRVEDVVFRGEQVRLVLKLGAATEAFHFDVATRLDLPKINDAITLALTPAGVLCLG